MSYNYCNLEGTLKVDGYEQSINGEVVMSATLSVLASDDSPLTFGIKLFAQQYAYKNLVTMDGQLITITGRLIPYQKSLALYVSWFDAPKVEPEAQA